MSKPLPQSFFNRPADIVARELLGCMLCVKKEGKIHRLSISETEAYMGPHDLASHASKGKTPRTEIMFRTAGTIYVYLIYGMYEMFNVVTGSENYPAAVLIRGAGEYTGPGKLTKALGITRDVNGSILGKTAGVWIEEGVVISENEYVATSRIGVSYAKEWAHANLRYVLIN